MPEPKEVALEIGELIEMLFDDTPNASEIIALITQAVQAGQMGYQSFKQYTPETWIPHFIVALDDYLDEQFVELKEKEE